MKKTVLTVLLTMVLGAFASLCGAEEFPLRKDYPEVSPMTTGELAERFDQALVVDVRSEFEFDVAHINGAVNLPVSKVTFAADLEKVRSKDGAAPLVFYCNGHTCAKSYKAVEIAAKEGFANLYAYDAGVFDWIVAQPEKATLMGRTPADKGKIISKESLKAKMVDFEEFKKIASEPGTVTIDIRDPFQRKEIPKIPMLRNIPLDRLQTLIGQKKLQGERFLFLDAVGKQVRWLQYHLEENGYTDYAFLDKGVSGNQ